MWWNQFTGCSFRLKDRVQGRACFGGREGGREGELEHLSQTQLELDVGRGVVEGGCQEGWGRAAVPSPACPQAAPPSGAPAPT